VYKKLLATVLKDCSAFNKNLSALRYTNKEFFLKQDLEKAESERKAISSLQHTTFLSTVFATPPVLYLNQLN
jgi:hypothetical protein